MTASTSIPDQIKPLHPDVARMLSSIEPSTDEFGLRLYPCEATLDDGSIQPRVYLVDAASFMRGWGVWPWKDQAKSWIPAERIRSVRSSTLRLPARFANEILAGGESGMGYCCFSVKLRSGRRLHFVTGNAVDFPNWPEGVTADDVVSVKWGDRHPEHRDRPPTEEESSARFAWSPFRPQ